MQITAKQKHKLRKFVQDVKHHKAAHTEFITVLVPAGYDLTRVINQLADEIGTASNIKSTSTRKNVQGALEKMIVHLRNIGKTPPNGLAAFSGNVASREGKTDFQVWSIEPPIPLNIKIYRCDKEFVTEHIELLIEEHNVYGLVVMDRRDATFALLKGKAIVPLTKTHSHVPGKFKAGGQCCLFGTLVQLYDGSIIPIEEIKVGDVVKALKDDFLIGSKVTDKWEVKKEEVVSVITDKSELKLDCSLDHIVFVSEEDKMKEKVAGDLKEGDILFSLNGDIVEKIKVDEVKITNKQTPMIDISVVDENFIANGLFVHNSSQRFDRLIEGAAKDHMKKVAEIMKEQFLGMKELKGIIVGGPGPTKYDLVDSNWITDQVKRKIIGIKDIGYTGEFGLQELVERSEDLLAKEEIMEEKRIMGKFFDTLAKDPQKVAYGKHQVEKAITMGAVDVLILSEILDLDTIENLSDEAEALGSTVSIISTETREGVQLKDIGGYAALLRYPIE